MGMKPRKPKGGLHLRVPAAQQIDYKDIDLLERCLSPQGQIQHRNRD